MSGNGHETARAPAPIDRVRELPHDDASERGRLGAILIDDAALSAATEAGVTAADFYDPARRAVYEQMLALETARVPIDTVTLVHGLERSGALAAIGGVAGLASMADGDVIPSHAHGYAAKLRALGRVRGVMRTCRAILARGYVAHEDPDAFVADAVREFFDATKEARAKPYVHVALALDEAYAQIEQASNQPEHVAGIATGLRGLDRYLGGFQKSDLVIVAGRPGSGKTSLAIQIAADAAARHGSRVLIFSLEMSRVALAHRLLSRASGIEGSRLRHGIAKAEGTAPWNDLHGAIAKLRDLPIWMSDDAAITAPQIQAKARRLAGEHGGVDLVVVDYLQLMAADRRAETRALAVAESTRALKALAKEMGAPVVALSQLSRAVEQRGPDARPRLSDLRESGSIEQDADVVIFLHAEHGHEDAGAAGYPVEAIVAKHRNGRTGVAGVHFSPHLTRFENLVPVGDLEDET